MTKHQEHKTIDPSMETNGNQITVNESTSLRAQIWKLLLTGWNKTNSKKKETLKNNKRAWNNTCPPCQSEGCLWRASEIPGSHQHSGYSAVVLYTQHLNALATWQLFGWQGPLEWDQPHNATHWGPRHYRRPGLCAVSTAGKAITPPTFCPWGGASQLCLLVCKPHWL